ncbi:MAG: PIN domain-containing protein [Gemmatimonadetes bacterium]|nr:type II toxin-antitoxin system VapC family toxin [Gemmatimonadota bacterium]NIR77185.1 type II toxin-antitoxin system VapC family toxin [Gemmatimonadota bacterium]NIT85701.1 type II toxin-antitoxin system VapC family toxin [Gemmatimonadota bacterium]NIU29531.1 type II toxin-antitoxin system VapC family toxin [Gemmatimonadota bacterium]NIU34578.1 PIN domain-containing protein [Gemmatimonadota bacterium]
MAVVVELLLGGKRAERVIPWFEAEEGELHAPALLDVEVARALRRLAASGAMEASRAGAAVEILQDLPVTRHVETPLLPRIWQLRAKLTAYDAAYVVLPEAIGCRLVTCDAGLAGAPGLPVEVEIRG